MNDLEALRQQHESGDRLALFECVILCERERLQVPDWVRQGLAKALGKYLENPLIDLEDAFFGASRSRGGRHADPRRERETRLHHQAVVAANRGATMAGLRGRDRLLAAAEVYDSIYPKSPLEPETMAKIYYSFNGLGVDDPGPTQPPVELANDWGSRVSSTDNAITASGILSELRRR